MVHGTGKSQDTGSKTVFTSIFIECVKSTFISLDYEILRFHLRYLVGLHNCWVCKYYTKITLYDKCSNIKHINYVWN